VRRVTDAFIDTAVAIALEFYLIGRLVLKSAAAAPLALGLLAIFAFLRAVLPRLPGRGRAPGTTSV
jgi:hypothetical protein